jgi:hypothetical protein
MLSTPMCILWIILIKHLLIRLNEKLSDFLVILWTTSIKIVNNVYKSVEPLNFYGFSLWINILRGIRIFFEDFTNFNYTSMIVIMISLKELPAGSSFFIYSISN